MCSVALMIFYLTIKQDDCTVCVRPLGELLWSQQEHYDSGTARPSTIWVQLFFPEVYKCHSISRKVRCSCYTLKWSKYIILQHRSVHFKFKIDHFKNFWVIILSIFRSKKDREKGKRPFHYLVDWSRFKVTAVWKLFWAIIYAYWCDHFIKLFDWQVGIMAVYDWYAIHNSFQGDHVAPVVVSASG